MKKIIWSNTIVHNEENFIWFSLMSVVDFVDKMLVWDTGSSDNTARIIEEVKKIKGDKIEYRQIGNTNRDEFTNMRQKMLEESKCDWIIVLDGDEIWWKKSLLQVIERINQENNISGIVVPMLVPVGDIYHLQDKNAGKYQILGRKGHLSLKLINRKTVGLHVNLPYGKEGYFDKDNRLIQERDDIIFLEAPLLHLTHLKRSDKRREYDKVKYELGEKVPMEFKFPEVFYQSYPSFIRSPWVKMTAMEYLKAGILTPLRRIKRKIYG